MQVLFMAIMVVAFTVGVYSNLYVYQSFDGPLLFGTAILPYGGYLCGGLLALAFRLNWTLVKVNQRSVLLINDFSSI